ncbi:hypothetical protein [Leptospira sp. 'Mane']|uniref:hypothetical protein n=1 Tax=Leptospira sp. 'Mane' TaxID=3387407 RepID=UPI00398B40CB
MKYSFKVITLFLCFAFLLFLGCKSALLDLCPVGFAFDQTSTIAESSHLPKCHQTTSDQKKNKNSKQNCDCPLAFQELRTAETSFSLEKWEIQWIKTFIPFFQIGFVSNLKLTFSPDDPRSFHTTRYFSSTDHFLDSVRLLI